MHIYIKVCIIKIGIKSGMNNHDSSIDINSVVFTHQFNEIHDCCYFVVYTIQELR